MQRQSILQIGGLLVLLGLIASGALAGPDLIRKLINYPNPFNPELETTTIEYELARDCLVELTIYDLSGRVVFSRQYQPGQNGGQRGLNRIQWNGRNDRGEMVQNGAYIGCVRVKLRELISPLYESKRLKIGVKR